MVSNGQSKFEVKKIFFFFFRNILCSYDPVSD